MRPSFYLHILSTLTSLCNWNRDMPLFLYTNLVCCYDIIAHKSLPSSKKGSQAALNLLKHTHFKHCLLSQPKGHCNTIQSPSAT